MTQAPVLAALLGAVAVVALCGCQTTQETSRRKALRAKGLAHEKGLKVGAANRDVAVARTAVLHDANGDAAVVELRNAGRRPQARVPVALSLRDRRGHRVYTNTLGGLDESLTSVALLDGRDRAWWVNNQIIATGRPARARVRVGTSRTRVPPRVPRIVLSRVRLDRDADGPYATGVAENRSDITQKRLVVACVARRGRRIVAAGRSVIDKLPPAPTPKPVRFKVYFIGNPQGATLELEAPPTVLQ